MQGPWNPIPRLFERGWPSTVVEDGPKMTEEAKHARAPGEIDLSRWTVCRPPDIPCRKLLPRGRGVLIMVYGLRPCNEFACV
eukprot:9466559-Pyramimonas_sp.AAC.1